jgi:hypothetical protein
MLVLVPQVLSWTNPLRGIILGRIETWVATPSRLPREKLGTLARVGTKGGALVGGAEAGNGNTVGAVDIERQAAPRGALAKTSVNGWGRIANIYTVSRRHGEVRQLKAASG